jgi:hypothetical protein
MNFSSGPEKIRWNRINGIMYSRRNSPIPGNRWVLQSKDDNLGITFYNNLQKVHQDSQRSGQLSRKGFTHIGLTGKINDSIHDGNVEDSRRGCWTVAVHGHVKDYLDMGSGVLQLFMGSYLVHG